MSIIILFDGHIHLCHMVSLLNFAAGFDGRDEFFAINETLIKAAFRSCSKEFCISYKFMGIDKGGEDRVFSARVKKRIGSSRSCNGTAVTDFAFFSSIIEDGMASKKESKQSPHSEENEGDSSEQLKPGETMLRCALLLFFVESGSGFLLWV